jgi:hypothetical protein
MEFDTIQTDAWSIQIPQDWEQKPFSGKLYFEAPDGTKGLYLVALKFGPDDLRTVADHLGVLENISMTSLNNMTGYQWTQLKETKNVETNAGEMLIDNYDRAKHYRIIERALVKLPLLGQVSIHDYLCEDISQSDDVLSHVLGSFALK